MLTSEIIEFDKLEVMNVIIGSTVVSVVNDPIVLPDVVNDSPIVENVVKLLEKLIGPIMDELPNVLMLVETRLEESVLDTGAFVVVTEGFETALVNVGVTNVAGPIIVAVVA